ncbi:hypothetical protein ES703_68643 [subsurface metagenome]
MEIFVDSASIAEIEKWLAMGGGRWCYYQSQHYA